MKNRIKCFFSLVLGFIQVSCMEVEFIYTKINLVVSGQMWFKENSDGKECIGLWTNVMLSWLRICKKINHINLDQGIHEVKRFLITSCHGMGIKLASFFYNHHRDSILLLLLDFFSPQNMFIKTYPVYRQRVWFRQLNYKTQPQD